jgi:hypothetical protein
MKPIKNLHDAKVRIAELEAKLGIKADQPEIENPYKNPGKPAKAPNENPNPRPLNPRTPHASVSTSHSVKPTATTGNRSSLDAARSDIKAANGYKAKLDILSQTEANILSEFEVERKSGNMKEQTRLNRNLVEVQQASAKLMLAEKTELGPRASRAAEILRRNDLD